MLGAATAKGILSAAFASDDWQLSIREEDGSGAINSSWDTSLKVELNEGGLAEPVPSLNDKL